ncbi:MAG: hypothetical protein AAF518_05935 [Spirochaetota bacterium]
MKWIFRLCILLLISCAPKKDSVSNIELRRLLERVAVTRVSHRLSRKVGAPLKTDREIFLEACKVFRLSPELALEKIQKKNPKLYSRLKGEE